MPAEDWWEELGDSLGEQELAIIRQMSRWEQHTFLTKLVEAVADVTHVAQQLNDAGQVVIKIKVAPSAPSNPLMALTARITKTMPSPKALGSHGYFVNGEWFDRDPSAPTLPEGRAAVRDVERRLAEKPVERRKVGDDDGGR